MPPEDALFEVNDDAAPEGAPAPQSNGADPGRQPVSFADVTRIMEEVVTPNTRQMETLGRNQAQLTSTVEQIAGILSRLGLDQQAGEGRPDPTEWISDPEGHTRRIAESVADARMREQVAPLLGQLVNQTHTDVVNHEKSSIDAEFGAGTWDKEFAPELNPIFDRTRKEAPSQLGNRDAILNAVRTVKGMKLDRLFELRQAHRQGQSEAADAERKKTLDFVTSNMSGGIRRTQESSTLSQEAKAMLEAEFRATGSSTNEKELLAALGSGGTIDDFLASQAKSQKGAK